MVAPPGNHRGLDLRRTYAVRRKVRDTRTPGRTSSSAVAAGGSCIMQARTHKAKNHNRRPSGLGFMSVCKATPSRETEVRTARSVLLRT
jgi:hypothetical protein